MGFKGIWAHADADQVLAELEQARDEAKQHLESPLFKEFAAAGVEVHHAFLSDTFVVSMQPTRDEPLGPDGKGLLVLAVSAVLQRVARRLIYGKLRFPLPL